MLLSKPILNTPPAKAIVAEAKLRNLPTLYGDGESATRYHLVNWLAVGSEWRAGGRARWFRQNRSSASKSAA